MVIPLPPLPITNGPPPEEAQDDLRNLKWSIVAMIGFGIGRAVFALLQNALSFDAMALGNLFLSIVMGTFMFKDDEHLKKFYDCLAQTICQMCAESGQGGLQCLVPFMFCTGINFAFDLISRAGLLVFMPYGLFLGGSLASQAMAVWFSYRVFKILRGLAPDLGTQLTAPGAGGGYARPGADAVPHQAYEDGRPEPSAPPAAGGGGRFGFVPFGGQGNRLGG
mmetsp:Transcript_22732/g.48266  ORF Transcript_22732/g.48266 Transcript_22732/m.48266 type:complete len:222 (-) Transcript_22732:70-735(-)